MRVHHDEVQEVICLLDAIATSKQQHCIVISSSLSTITLKKKDGSQATYSTFLKEALGNCEMSTHPSGNVVYTHKKQQPSTASG